MARLKKTVTNENGESDEVFLTSQEEKAIRAQWVAADAEQAVQAIQLQIAELESEQTARRVREAVLGIDDGWFANQELLIGELRVKLKNKL